MKLFKSKNYRQAFLLYLESHWLQHAVRCTHTRPASQSEASFSWWDNTTLSPHDAQANADAFSRLPLSKSTEDIYLLLGHHIHVGNAQNRQLSGGRCRNKVMDELRSYSTSRVRNMVMTGWQAHACNDVTFHPFKQR